MNKLISYADAVTSIGDVLIDVFNVVAIKKQNKTNRNLLLGTQIALSVLAVGVSMYQTNSIKKAIRAYSGKNGHWG